MKCEHQHISHVFYISFFSKVYPTSVSGFIHVAQVNIDVSRIEGAKEKIKSDVWMKM